MTDPSLAYALIAFVALTMAHVFVLVLYRTSLILTGTPVTEFTPSRDAKPVDLIGRISGSHANCIENLPLFAAVLLAHNLANSEADITEMAWYYVYARCGQALAHCTSVSFAAITARFSCFFTSYLLLASMAYAILSP